MRHSKSILAIPVALIAAALLHACGGGTDGSGTSNTTAVSAYLTDDLGGYQTVEFKLLGVELRHPVTPACKIIDEQEPINFAALGRDQILQFVDTTMCPAGPYNRLYVELEEKVTLNDGSGPRDCKFVSYFDDSLPVPQLPNVLDCNGGICSLNITGAVNLITGNHEHVALDVDLKNFKVNLDPTCTVTLKVSPIHADGKLTAGFRKRITGAVSDLNTGTDTFTLTTVKGKQFTVQYSGVTDQPGIDDLLERAAMDQLRTSVRCQTIDMATSPPNCTAQTNATHPLKAIAVKAKGTISLLDTTAQTLTLNYGAGTMLPVNYATAAALGKVMGTLADNAAAEATLYGFASDFFLAREVEVE